MFDKHHRRPLRAPHGSAPNWLLMTLAAGGFALALLALSFA